jgi:hypothetical protein
MQSRVFTEQSVQTEALQIVIASGREGLSQADAQIRIWCATHDPEEIKRRDCRRRAAGFPPLDRTDPKQIARAVLNSVRNEREREARQRHALYLEAMLGLEQ